jgi:hypothetical protein
MAVHCIKCGSRHFAVPTTWLDLGGRLNECPDCPAPYREELTAAGPQLVIPGCERRPPDNGKPAQLSLFA